MTVIEPRLAHVRVRDVMHTGILATDAGTPLRVVARLMAEQSVHAIAVTDAGGGTRRPWGIVSALDVVRAAAADVEETAGQAVAGEVVTVSSAERLDYAAQVMVDHGLSHVIVVDPASGYPSGILSTLDVVAAYAG